MSRRDHVIQIVGSILAAVLAVLGAAGVIPGMPKVPPAQVPPAQVPPQLMPPAPTPADIPADPLGSRVKLLCGSSGCTGAVVGPRRTDGRYWVVTAAHCVSGVGQHCTGQLPDGRTLALVVSAVNRTADCCWMLTEQNDAALPHIRLASAAAPVGSRVWVAGYGTHAPGVQRWGAVVAAPNPAGQCAYTLAVSHGDSGGPIVHAESGELLGVVCCTSALGRDGRVYGAGPAAMAASRPTSVGLLQEWRPLAMPHRE